MSFNKDRVETKFIEFNPHNDFLKGLKNYVDHLIKVGYSDIAIESHIIPMIRNTINMSREPDTCLYCKLPITDGQLMIYEGTKPIAHYSCHGKKK
jgi:hypothetical protein